MIRSVATIIAMLVTYVGSVADDCCQSTGSFTHIVLNGFSESNYDALEASLDSRVCITGPLSIDSMGVYYPLQPIEKDGIIDIGFSRVDTGLNRVLSLKRGLKNSKVYTLCGVLESKTVFNGCDTNDCRWYHLKRAALRRKGLGFKG